MKRFERDIERMREYRGKWEGRWRATEKEDATSLGTRSGIC